MQKDKYKEPITIKFSNAVVRVFSPIISNEEREKRIKAIHRASANILEGVEK